jgi:glutamyl-Q tRNA(Asp) synthetase
MRAENQDIVSSHRTTTVGRFAPSPTGPLHFGSLVAAVGSYCLARQAGGRWLLRIEDLDTPRVVPGAADDIMHVLEQLGLFWDGPVIWQSRRGEAYQDALERLRQSGLLFECACSRREILASAPHPGEEGPVYPGTCRPGLTPGRRPRMLRIRVPNDPICFIDGVYGPRAQNLPTAVGDFVVRRADGLFAYQLAVVVDDAEFGITQVVRGADLLLSTPRQIFLQTCLGYRIPHYVHLPLVLSDEGEKISKRHGTINIVRAGREGELLSRALRFLGQDVPAEVREAPVNQILAWAVSHFDLSRVPGTDRRENQF